MRFYTLVLTFVLCVAYGIAEKSALQLVSNSIEPFSLQFLKEVSKENEGNLICSALSAYIVLSMAAYGAEGNTYVQMHDSLYLPADDNLAQQGFQNLVEELNKVGNDVLNVANKIYVANDFQPKPEFKQLTSRSFLSEIGSLDIEDPEAAATEVNNWVSDETQKKITKLVEKKEITGDTRMILLNAIYFNGKWAKAFKQQDTTNRPFKYMENDELKEKLVSTMYNKEYYFYKELRDLKAKFIELPYQNSSLKMLVAVPNEVNGLDELIRNLNSTYLNRIRSTRSKTEVELYLPKFKIEKEIKLVPVLQKMGMTDMFTGAANFARISNENIMISEVKQKAVINVNEEGTEAAAATSVHVITKSLPREPIELKVDRPFMFKILTDQYLELFSGIVTDPQSKY